jgi:hypothetical protein
MARYQTPPFQGVSDGVHEVEILDGYETVSKNGHPQIVFKLRADNRGRSFYERLAFTPPAFWKVEQFLLAMGEKPVEGLEVNPHAYIGRTARVLIGTKEFNGQKTNTVLKWFPLEPPPPAVKDETPVSDEKGE